MVNFMTVRIDDKKCDYCLECVNACPSGALTYDKCFEHNGAECSYCEVCMDLCPNEAINVYPMED